MELGSLFLNLNKLVGKNLTCAPYLLHLTPSYIRMCSLEHSRTHTHTTHFSPQGRTKSAYSEESAVIRSSRHPPRYEGKLRFHRLLLKPHETLYAVAAAAAVVVVVGGKGVQIPYGAMQHVRVSTMASAASTHWLITHTEVVGSPDDCQKQVLAVSFMERKKIDFSQSRLLAEVTTPQN